MRRDSKREAIFSTIRTSRIPDEVYRQIVALISSGRLKPGEKLPSEREMAAEFGVSRQSVREALSKARSMGLIEIRQGEGSFVLSTVGESMGSPLKVILEEQAERIFEFLEIRKLVEGWCAQRAAREAKGEDLEKMKEILQRMRKSNPAQKEWESLDVAFHLAIAEASHNVIALHVMEALKESFDSFFVFRKALKTTEREDLLWQHHHEIFQAIEKGDPTLARERIIKHLDFIGEKIKKQMKKIK